MRVRKGTQFCTIPCFGLKNTQSIYVQQFSIPESSGGCLSRSGQCSHILSVFDIYQFLAMQKHRPLTICKQDWLTMHISDVLNDLKIAVNPLINQNVAFPMSESSDSYADCKSSCGPIQKMCLVEPSCFHL